MKNTDYKTLFWLKNTIQDDARFKRDEASEYKKSCNLKRGCNVHCPRLVFFLEQPFFCSSGLVALSV